MEKRKPPQQANRSFRTRIELLTTAEGGRSTALRSGYRSLLRREGEDLDIGFQLDLEEASRADGLAPGASATGVVSYLVADVPADLRVGQRFEIREGHRVVGRGTVVGARTS